MLHGLYAITDSSATLVADVEQALRGGAAAVQYRDKRPGQPRRENEARALMTLCRRYQRPLIINDDVELALQVRASGVHLGRDDMPLASARQRLGPGAIIGVSCYNDLTLARAAERQGADYVAFGSFFGSPTKPKAVVATPALLQQARKELNIPIIAIGGITADNGAVLIAAGASALAAISGVFGQTDIYQAARRYAQLFEPAVTI